MCYQISFNESLDAIYESLPELDPEEGLDIDLEPMVFESGFTFPKHPILVKEEKEIKVKVFHWGMIAEYMKAVTIDGADKKALDNQRRKLLLTRAERVIEDHHSVWYGKRQKRVLIPATGFFEYREVAGFKNKIPYYIHLKDRPLFFLPGLYNYSHIPNKDGELIGTFSLIIRAANSVMRQIHNSGDHPFRMPLMLTKELEQKWLQPNLSDEAIQSILDFEMPSNELDYWPVKSLYRADPFDKELIKPFVYEGLEAQVE
ncbi:SOS response-associated peptidase [Arachidicoccus soli]|uniref:Abasic site processing protein n=1 Tax=Arachidicoccus soli TaxID=2341117 RepID=A0A386HNX3_9BACT|nr:SOS response-associated peptidase family protein [Arachidicoccus soli]AYD47372.1 DUF159 family protein [Arachidicoccus soli]